MNCRFELNRIPKGPLALALSITLLAGCGGSDPVDPTANDANPDFGANVIVFDTKMAPATIQATVEDIFQQQVDGQFNAKRFALLFKPGSYNTNINVGFYTQVLGLGKSPNDVNITGDLTVNAKWFGKYGADNNATQNFWRTVENFTVTPSDGEAHWAVAQATSFRRMSIMGKLRLDDNWGWASGGYIADSAVSDETSPNTQQQWISRNAEYAKPWNCWMWNCVFVGSTNSPEGTF
ncbi:MAG: hypothetical protein V4805_07680, partial [Pseudomonadota bacterium]